MNVMFVSQYGKLEELMCLQLTASAHRPQPQTMCTLVGREHLPGWKNTAQRTDSRRGKEGKRKEERLARTYQMLTLC